MDKHQQIMESLAVTILTLSPPSPRRSYPITTKTDQLQPTFLILSFSHGYLIKGKHKDNISRTKTKDIFLQFWTRRPGTRLKLLPRYLPYLPLVLTTLQTLYPLTLLTIFDTPSQLINRNQLMLNGRRRNLNQSQRSRGLSRS